MAATGKGESMKTVVALTWLLLAIVPAVTACSGGRPAPADSRTAAFDAWLSEARPVFAAAGAGLESIVDDYHCQNQEIGDGLLTEPACTGIRYLSVAEEPVSIQVDWSVSNPRRWHADVDLDTPLKVKCAEIQSSAEYHRTRNEFAELVACRTQAGDEALLLLAPTHVIMAYLSADFVQAYPGYVSGLIQTGESSP